jgi:hypothetical protein
VDGRPLIDLVSVPDVHADQSGDRLREVWAAGELQYALARHIEEYGQLARAIQTRSLHDLNVGTVTREVIESHARLTVISKTVGDDARCERAPSVTFGAVRSALHAETPPSDLYG